jgi:hypothetical protein
MEMSKLVIDLKMNVITVGGKIVIDMNEEKIMVNMDGDPQQVIEGNPQMTLHEWFNKPEQVTEDDRSHDAISGTVREKAKRKREWYVGKRIVMKDGTKATVMEHIRGRQYLVRYSMNRPSSSGGYGTAVNTTQYAAHFEKQDYWDWWVDRKQTKIRDTSKMRVAKTCSLCGVEGHNKRTCPDHGGGN